MEREEAIKLMCLNISKIGSSPVLKELFNFNRTEARILMELENNGEMTPTELCEATGLSTPHMAKTLKNLTLKAKITRKNVIDDRRKQIITITEKGRKYLNDTSTVLIEGINNLLGDLKDEEIEEIVNSFSKLYNVLETRTTND